MFIMNKNPLKKRIGIIGGGQLGKMMILEAKKLGFFITILDPTEQCPAHSVSDKHIVANFDDEKSIRQLAECSDVLTYEFEHIEVSILRQLEKEGYSVYPTAASLQIIQNKYDQKTVLQHKKIPVPRLRSIYTIEEVYKAGEQYGYPIVLKTCLGGYDGKGNYIIRNQAEVEDGFNVLGEGKTPLMAEEFVPFMKEISVLACRGIQGEICVYPVGENHHKNSILDETIVPAFVSEEAKRSAMEIAHDVMEVFAGVGMFCVEMFVTENEEVLVNEVAPRPHNSGHYTIEGCITSQFEQHIRAITGLPFGDVSLLRPTVMKNILGEEETGKVVYEGVEKALKIQNAKVHIYGKVRVEPNRKMGHITVIDESIDEALKKAREAHKYIRCKGI